MWVLIQRKSIWVAETFKQRKRRMKNFKNWIIVASRYKVYIMNKSYQSLQYAEPFLYLYMRVSVSLWTALCKKDPCSHTRDKYIISSIHWSGIDITSQISPGTEGQLFPPQLLFRIRSLFSKRSVAVSTKTVCYTLFLGVFIHQMNSLLHFRVQCTKLKVGKH